MHSNEQNTMIWRLRVPQLNLSGSFNTLKGKRNGRHVADNIHGKCIVATKTYILLYISIIFFFEWSNWQYIITGLGNGLRRQDDKSLPDPVDRRTTCVIFNTFASTKILSKFKLTTRWTTLKETVLSLNIISQQWGTSSWNYSFRQTQNAFHYWSFCIYLYIYGSKNPGQWGERYIHDFYSSSPLSRWWKSADDIFTAPLLIEMIWICKVFMDYII